MYAKIKKHFEDTREFVSLRFPKFRKFKLNIGCPEIIERRKYHREGYRTYMHTNHTKNTVCVHLLAEKLSSKHLYGLFLHEFGHHLRGGNKRGEIGQMGADTAVLREFGISIWYDRKKQLQYIKGV